MLIYFITGLREEERVSIIELNIGGEIFFTTNKVFKNSSMLKDVKSSKCSITVPYFNTNPKLFPLILDYLRTKSVTVFDSLISNEEIEALNEELKFFELNLLVPLKTQLEPPLMLHDSLLQDVANLCFEDATHTSNLAWQTNNAYFQVSHTVQVQKGGKVFNWLSFHLRLF